MKYAALFLIVYFLVGCGEAGMAGNVKFKAGAGVGTLMADNPGLFSSECSDEIGVCLHKFKFPFASSNLPSVTVLVPGGGPDLQISNVVSAKVFDLREAEGKLNSVDLTLQGVPSQSQHKVAKDYAYSIIRKIQGAGWRRYLSPKDPRIAGAQSAKIPVYNEVSGVRVKSHPWFDPAYEMSDEQWLSVSGLYNWYFYNNGSYIVFRGQRSQSEQDAAGQASYLFTLAVESEESVWRQAFAPEDKAEWKALLPPLIESYRTRREALEDKAEQEGIVIDRSIEDAPISVLKK
ncbi:hypothetical protein [Pseudomonas xanthosomatis]|uniref:hypothetical protein n=1 Tax=Pseudomonas xanthosomatis TaxID=2842356 RepID=UPI003514B40D